MVCLLSKYVRHTGKISLDTCSVDDIALAVAVEVGVIVDSVIVIGYHELIGCGILHHTRLTPLDHRNVDHRQLVVVVDIAERSALASVIYIRQRFSHAAADDLVERPDKVVILIRRFAGRVHKFIILYVIDTISGAEGIVLCTRMEHTVSDDVGIFYRAFNIAVALYQSPVDLTVVIAVIIQLLVTHQLISIPIPVKLTEVITLFQLVAVQI